MQTISPLVTEL